ncbi:hypothetical protein HPP92_025830 [Vanilla planifolia]|nr:hypothetical protein HPP92_025830 [Vanilla planifolia]
MAGLPLRRLVAMVAAIGTTFLETVAAGYYARAKERNVMQPIKLVADEDKAEEGQGASDAHLHSQAMHGCTHRNESCPADDEVPFRHRLISQVLELGIMVHSVIIGISLGVSKDPSTVRPLVAALSFHQFFEGMGLGGCFVHAQLKLRSMTTMVLLFSFTTPLAIVVGIGISFGYKENDSFATIIEGILNSGAAGILIYIGLVDLLAVDFMNPRVQKDEKLQLMLSISLLIGAAPFCYAVLLSLFRMFTAASAVEDSAPLTVPRRGNLEATMGGVWREMSGISKRGHHKMPNRRGEGLRGKGQHDTWGGE